MTRFFEVFGNKDLWCFSSTPVKRAFVGGGCRFRTLCSGGERLAGEERLFWAEYSGHTGFAGEEQLIQAGWLLPNRT